MLHIEVWPYLLCWMDTWWTTMDKHLPLLGWQKECVYKLYGSVAKHTQCVFQLCSVISEI